MDINQKKLIGYLTGFLLSLLFTLGAYALVEIHVSSDHTIISHAILLPSIIVLAFAQLIVQLYFFLHLGEKSGERWKQVAFFLAVGLIFIIVVGSIWIMNNLNYNMTPQQINQYLIDQSG